MNIGGAEVLIVLVFAVVVLLPLAALIDGLMHETPLWHAAGYSKIVWIPIAVLALFVPVLGLGAAVVYFAVIRPKLEAPRRAAQPAA